MNEQTQSFHDLFVASARKHILMITHGIHQWNVIPGLPDTGGQNVFINQMTETLAELGFKITIANRGGYPHPKTGEMHRGTSYKDRHQRILYTEDDTKEFVRKEDMHEHTPQLADFIHAFHKKEDTMPDMIISHYWDGAQIGALLNRKLDKHILHAWVPHSLGLVKKNNVAPERWKPLRIDERIEVEKNTFPELDYVAATSSFIAESLRNDYGCKKPLFLPPCVKADRFHPRDLGEDHEIWHFLKETTGMPVKEIQKCKIVTEISRTDTTKRKDVLIDAFAKVHKKIPDTFLIVSIDETEHAIAAELKHKIYMHDIESHVAAIGNEWERLPYIYAATAVYCSPSVMEGFGMAVQEAAATRVPVVGSHLIPFVKEYLLGDQVEEVAYEEMKAEPLKVGTGAILVHADDVDGFAKALEIMLDDPERRRQMGENAYNATIPYFTWQHMTRRFLKDMDVAIAD